MHQRAITDEPFPQYALVSAYQLVSADRAQIRAVIARVRQRFETVVFHVSKELHELLTGEQRFDVPAFPRLEGVAVTQADLFLLIGLENPLSQEKIWLKRATHGVFRLVEQKFVIQAAEDPAGVPYFEPRAESVTTENGGSYVFYLRFACDATSYAYLSKEEQARVQANRAQRWEDLHGTKLRCFNYFDSGAGFLLVGYQADLVIRFGEFVRKILGFADEFTDEYITEFCQLQATGIYYCLCAEQLEFAADPQLAVETTEPARFAVSKTRPWPKKDDEEEPPEEEKEEEEKLEKEKGEEQEEKEEKEEAEKAEEKGEESDIKEAEEEKKEEDPIIENEEIINIDELSAANEDDEIPDDGGEPDVEGEQEGDEEDA